MTAPLFHGMKKEEIESMLQCLGSFEKSYCKGEYIILEQDKVECIGVILMGTVDMIKEDVWGNKTIMLRIKEHQLFGETFACSKDAMASVSFYASSNCRVIFLQFEKVMCSCSRSCMFHHRLIENMVRLVANKNKELMDKMGVLSKKNIREKIMAYLSLQAQLQGKTCFEIPLGRLELAEYLSVDRSALTRELSNMRTAGLIEYDKNVFQILRQDID